MAVRIRMTRVGRKHRPFYRIGAYDSRTPRNGKCIDKLGWYDPLLDAEKQFVIDIERANHWLSVGAQPTPKTAILLKKAGISLNKEKKSNKNLPKPKQKQKKSRKQKQKEKVKK